MLPSPSIVIQLLFLPHVSKCKFTQAFSLPNLLVCLLLLQCLFLIFFIEFQHSILTLLGILIHCFNTLTATRFYSEIPARSRVPLYRYIFRKKMIPEEALDAHANSVMQIQVVKSADQEHEIM